MNNLSSQISTADLKTMRQSSYDETLNNIRTNSSPDENRFVFDNLILLKREFKTHARKRNYDSIQSDDTTIVATSDENLPPPKKVCLSKQPMPTKETMIVFNPIKPTLQRLRMNAYYRYRKPVAISKYSLKVQTAPLLRKRYLDLHCFLLLPIEP